MPSSSLPTPIGQCIICLSTLTSSNTFAITKCGHTFHKRCIFKWIKDAGTCPTCRKDAVKFDIIKLYIQELSFDDTVTNGKVPVAKVFNLQRKLEKSIEKQAKILQQKENLEFENLVLKEKIKKLEESEANKNRVKNGWFKSFKKSFSKKI